ncbi:hypothetical protein DPMN_098254 [Dreissena polymorpha]|uniref:Uncharacterized protein n=1 Tax=Dreissena polymorpha TaxID=45954 RepID=A0A9D4LD83_DREPO|nr:hypothetical protein DPMN_098254 [Dreissena polymorpha]
MKSQRNHPNYFIFLPATYRTWHHELCNACLCSVHVTNRHKLTCSRAHYSVVGRQLYFCVHLTSLVSQEAIDGIVTLDNSVFKLLE